MKTTTLELLTKSTIVALATIGLILIITGCSSEQNTLPTSTGPATTQTVWTPSQSDLDRIQVLATMGTGAGLQFGITDAEKRTALADEIYLLSSGTFQLTNGIVPSASDFKNYVLTFDGSQKTAEYVSMATSLSAIYGTYFSKINGNPKAAIQVINALALGAQQGADAYRKK